MKPSAIPIIIALAIGATAMRHYRPSYGADALGAVVAVLIASIGLDQSVGGFERIAYFGLGGVLLTAMAVSSWRRHRQALRDRPRAT